MKNIQGAFYKPSLEVTHIPSAHILLVRILLMATPTRKGLGSVVQLWEQENKETSFEEHRRVFRSCTKLRTCHNHIILSSLKSWRVGIN